MIKKRYILSAVSLTVLAIFSFSLSGAGKAQALSGSSFKAGRVIDDSVFFNGSSMSASQIQSFLNAKVPTCDTNHAKTSSSNDSGPPYTCLKSYSQNTPARPYEPALCSAMDAKSNQTAAQIIYSVSRACGISQKALIVLLQKEQSLITDTWPWDIQYRSATGYGCPDTAPCNSEYYGFFNQVYKAAWQFKKYARDTNTYSHKAGLNNNIRYHPNASCGTRKVLIENQATAGLYNYTPYTPNQAALDNLYGTGNSCSAYGNRNFWRMYSEWFGATTGVNITVEGYDLNNAKDGEPARFGIRLSDVPRASVYITTAAYSKSTGAIVGSVTLKINPQDWNKPGNNTVRIAGINNTGLVGTFENKLVIQKVVSSDARFNNYPVGLINDDFTKIALLDSNNPPNVYRLYNSYLAQHFISANKIDRDQKLAEGGWSDNGVSFSYCYGGEQTVYRMVRDNQRRLVVAGSQDYKDAQADGFVHEKADFAVSAQGNVPIYWLYDSGRDRSLYSTSSTEGAASGFVNQGVAFNTCSSDMEPVYQLAKPGGSRFYTKSSDERNKAEYTIGYVYEGLGFYTCDSGTKDVYRLYKGATGTRFYTTSTSERDLAANKLKYRYEGIGFRICNSSSRDVFRLYRGSDGSRYYTTSPYQRDKVDTQYGYRYEGVGFRVR